MFRKTIQKIFSSKHEEKTMRFSLPVLLLTGLLVSTVAVFGQMQDISAKTKSAKIKSIKVTSDTGKTAYVAKGKTIKLKTTVSVIPTTNKNKKVIYKSNKKKTVSVSSKGIVKGLRKGSATITVTSKVNKKKTGKIKIKVTEPIKQLQLIPTTLTLEKGKTSPLAVKYTPSKNICKNVKWFSSNEKIATVDKKGIVNAIGVGSTQVTVQALDGTKKKSTICTVTVKESIPTPPIESNDIASIEMLRANAIRIILKKPQALTVQAFTVQGKAHSSGSYISAYAISSLKTVDTKVYDLTLNGYAAEGDYITVTVQFSDSTGTLGVVKKSKEIVYKSTKATRPQDIYVSGYVDEYLSSSFEISGHTNGYVTVSAENLPQGLQYRVITENSYRYIEIFGTPTQTADGTSVKFTCTDEFGDKTIFSVYFYIGSSTFKTGYSYGTDVYSDEEFFLGTYFVGGTDNNVYEIVGESYGLSLISEGFNFLYGQIPTPGTYTVTVRATDILNSSLTKDIQITIKVVETVTVKGTVKTIGGSLVENTSLIFENTNPDITLSSRISMIDHNGTYTINVVPGTYDIAVSIGDDYDYTYKMAVGQSGNNALNLTIDAYKVTFTTTLSGTFEFTDWYTKDGTSTMGFGNSIYLKYGDYNLDCYAYSLDSNGNRSERYEATATFRITNANITVDVTLSESPFTLPTVGTLTVDTPKDVTSIWDDFVYLEFVPENTGNHLIFSSGTGDPYGIIYDRFGNILTRDDDTNLLDFEIASFLEEGETYYIGVLNWDGEGHTTSVTAYYIDY